MKMKATFLIIGLGFSLAFAPEVQAGEGHDAGYAWAEKHSIDDPDNCYDRYGNAINNSPSFTAGCLEYLHDEGITNDEDEPRRKADEDDPADSDE